MDSIMKSTSELHRDILSNALRMLEYRYGEIGVYTKHPRYYVYTIPVKNRPNVILIIHLFPTDFVTDQLNSFIFNGDSNIGIVVYSSACGTNRYSNKKRSNDVSNIQYIEHDILKFFLPDHLMTSRHKLISHSDDQYQIFTDIESNISLNTLPTISIDDPFTIYLGGVVNDVILIEAHNKKEYRKVTPIGVDKQ